MNLRNENGDNLLPAFIVWGSIVVALLLMHFLGKGGKP